MDTLNISALAPPGDTTLPVNVPQLTPNVSELSFEEAYAESANVIADGITFLNNAGPNRSEYPTNAGKLTGPPAMLVDAVIVAINAALSLSAIKNVTDEIATSTPQNADPEMPRKLDEAESFNENLVSSQTPQAPTVMPINAIQTLIHNSDQPHISVDDSDFQPVAQTTNVLPKTIKGEPLDGDIVMHLSKSPDSLTPADNDDATKTEAAIDSIIEEEPLRSMDDKSSPRHTAHYGNVTFGHEQQRHDSHKLTSDSFRSEFDVNHFDNTAMPELSLSSKSGLLKTVVISQTLTQDVPESSLGKIHEHGITQSNAKIIPEEINPVASTETQIHSILAQLAVTPDGDVLGDATLTNRILTQRHSVKLESMPSAPSGTSITLSTVEQDTSANTIEQIEANGSEYDSVHTRRLVADERSIAPPPPRQQIPAADQNHQTNKDLTERVNISLTPLVAEREPDAIPGRIITIEPRLSTLSGGRQNNSDVIIEKTVLDQSAPIQSNSAEAQDHTAQDIVQRSRTDALTQRVNNGLGRGITTPSSDDAEVAEIFSPKSTPEIEVKFVRDAEQKNFPATNVLATNDGATEFLVEEPRQRTQINLSPSPQYATPESTRDFKAQQISEDLRFRALERQVVTAAREGANQIRMQLYPPGMGQILIRLALDGSKLRLQIKTSSTEASNSLNEVEDALRSALAESGFTISSFDVTSENSDTRHGREPREKQTLSKNRQSGDSDFSMDLQA